MILSTSNLKKRDSVLYMDPDDTFIIVCDGSKHYKITQYSRTTVRDCPIPAGVVSVTKGSEEIFHESEKSAGTV